jgi:UDP-N-acetylglucosamine 2-epimerase (non-hydrolysing)
MQNAEVLVVIGTRPEAIKLAPVVLELRAHPHLTPVVVTTGQHRHLVDEVLELFDIEAAEDLGVDGTDGVGRELPSVLAAILSRLGDVLRRRQPTLVVVQGDTTSVLGAALACYYERIPVAHVEAGLRSGDRQAPFPEELNRQMTTLLADLHFAPTRSAADRLVAEGVEPGVVHLTGNTVIDALRLALARQEAFHDPRLKALDAEGSCDQPVIVVTAHRRESWGAALASVARAVEIIARAHPEVALVVSLHPNPLAAGEFGALAGIPNVILTSPLPYGEFVRLMDRASLILTDSGGIQEEAPSVGTPVLVLRDRTERMEGVRAGVARLVGTSVDRIVAEVGYLLEEPTALAAMVTSVDLYGDGTASRKNVETIARFLGVEAGQ